MARSLVRACVRALVINKASSMKHEHRQGPWAARHRIDDDDDNDDVYLSIESRAQQQQQRIEKHSMLHNVEINTPSSSSSSTPHTQSSVWSNKCKDPTELADVEKISQFQKNFVEFFSLSRKEFEEEKKGRSHWLVSTKVSLSLSLSLDCILCV